MGASLNPAETPDTSHPGPLSRRGFLQATATATVTAVLIAQGRKVFERAVADPDALAELPIVEASVTDSLDLDPAWDFDFDDQDETARRLPRLAAFYPE